MNNFAKTLIVALGLTVSGAAQADTDLALEVQDNGNGTFDIFGMIVSDGGDNSGGLSGFNISINGADTTTVMTPKFTVFIPPSTVQSYGFANGGAELTGDGFIFAGQNSLDEGSILRNLGIESGSKNALTGLVEWDAKLHIASGTYSGANFTYANIDFAASAANVWAGATGAGARAVDQVRAVPEPASIAMLGLGGLAMLRRRK